MTDSTNSDSFQPADIQPDLPTPPRTECDDGDDVTTLSGTFAERAAHYRAAALRVIPVHARSKIPIEPWKKYQTEKPTPETFERWCREYPDANIAVLCGDPSNGWADVDCDCRETSLLAPYTLPESEWIHGRKSNPDSHYWYHCSSAPKTRKFQDPTGKVLVELRGNRCLTVVEGIHESGEHIQRKPKSIVTSSHRHSPEAIEAVVGRLAAKALLGRSWPEEGSRHDCALATSAVLLQGGMSVEDTTLLILQAAGLAGDREAEDRREAVRTTANRIAEGAAVMGYDKLCAIIGTETVELFCDWLGLTSQTSGPGKRGPSSKEQSDDLLKLLQEVELFHDEERTPYVSYKHDGYTETCRIDDPEFEGFLNYQYLKSKGSVPNAEALKKALGAMKANARFEGPTCKVHVRVGEHEGKIYVDRADETRSVIEIDSEGWRTVQNPPVKFVRPQGMLGLPEPQGGGSLDLLRPLVNLPEDSSFQLACGWLLGTLMPKGPFPILVIRGEAGAAKTFTTKLLRFVIDPATTPLVATPRTDDNLMILAMNSLIPCYDNSSGLTNDQSDSLCRLAIGMGHRTRTLHTNLGETQIAAARPQIINGIDNIVRRGDLLSRSIVLDLPGIPPDARKTEDELLKKFREVHGLVLGALFDAVSAILSGKHRPTLPDLPRMADFLKWVSAAELSLGWERGTFLEAYKASASSSNDSVLDDSSVAGAICKFVKTAPLPWEGTATSLLQALDVHRPETGKSGAKWPASPAQLTTELRRIAANLREIGISVDNKRTGKSRLVVVNSEEDIGRSIRRAKLFGTSNHAPAREAA